MASPTKEMASPVAVAAASSNRAGGNRVGSALLLAGRLLLGAIFVFAAYSKLHFGGAWHLQDYHFFFAMAINSYNMLPLPVVQGMARVLPWLELVLGVMLILGIGLLWVSSAITLLLVVFMGALTRAAMLGLEINCGCFGYSSQKPTTELFHDSGLLILGLAVTVGAFLKRSSRRSTA